MNCKSDIFDGILAQINRKAIGRPFSFKLNQLPSLPNASVIRKKVNYYLKDDSTQFALTFQVNKTLIEAISGHPNLNLNELFTTPLSEQCYNTLIPQLKNLITDKNNDDAIRLLLSFVRSVGDYSDDIHVYGREFWMTPEESLFYSKLDCEDKSALFFYLTKELLNLPLIILDYPGQNHVNIGVGLEKYTDSSILYKKKHFYICEPTDILNRLDIGETGTNHKSYRVIGEFNPIIN